MCWRRVDQSNDVQSLNTQMKVWFPWDFDPEGNTLVCYYESAQGLGNQRILTLTGDDISGWKAMQSSNLIASAANEVDGRFSSDGQWLAYSSNESGIHQIYIANASGKGARLPISANQYQSRHPIWSKAKSELLFGTRTETFKTPFAVNDDTANQVYVSTFSASGGSLSVSTPVPSPKGISYGRFEIDPDGERLLVRSKVADSEKTFDQIKLFEGFADYLKEQLSNDKSSAN
jgi:hypothetical protein